MAFGLQNENVGDLIAAVQQGRSKNPGLAAMEGFKEGEAATLEQRKQAFAEKLADLTANEKAVGTKQTDAELQLKALLAGQESTVMDPVTKEVTKRPGLGWSYDPASHAMVQVAPQATGEKPPKVLPESDSQKPTGTIPGETDAAVTNLEGLLTANADSYGGLVGGGIYGTKRILDTGEGDVKFENTTQVNQGLRAEVLRLLRSSKLGQISEGERKFMMELAGSEPSENTTVRRLSIERLLRNARTLSALEKGQPVGAPEAANAVAPSSQSGQTEAIHTYPSGKKAKFNSSTGKWEPFNG